MKSIRFAIDSGRRDISNISMDDLISARKIANELPLQERTQFLEKLMKPIVPAFQHLITSPQWLKSNFYDSVWECKFGDIRKTINFNIKLEDGFALTDHKHRKLLYTLKFWYCSQSHPRYCGGKNIKSSTAYCKVLACLQFTDALLLRADYFQLSKHGLKLFSENDAFAMAECAMEGITEGYYQSAKRVTNFLLLQIGSITNEKIIEAAVEHPYILRCAEPKSLELTDLEIIKSRVWLLEQGAFNSPSSAGKAGSCRSTFFRNRIYINTLNGKEFNGCNFHELRITPLAQKNEYHSIPITSCYEGRIKNNSVRMFFNTLQSLNVITGDSFVGVPPESLAKISLKQMINYFNPKDMGRFRTLPAQVVLGSLKNAFEFYLKHMDDILEIMKKISNEKNLSKANILNRDKHLILNHFVRSNAPRTLIQLGVKRWSIVHPTLSSATDPNYYKKLRKNIGLNELYEVLIGSAQIIIGTIMARRVGEVISLKHDCLHPKDKDPTDPENKKIKYSIKSLNNKSGIGDTREKSLLPIPKSVAILIWKLQRFREEILKTGTGKLNSRLFVTYNQKSAEYTSIADTSFSQNFDTFCDYFETPLIQISENEYRRYYIRQHQLRRFFAMVFFWSSGFDGLDTLRYFLGHTDAEHLYHYITESTPGEVLRGVKAEVLVHGLYSDKIAGIEKLRVILKERFKAQDVTVEALEETIAELQHEVRDGFITTTPELDQLRKQLESNVDKLLSEGLIDLFPKFCTVQDESGEFIQEIHLILIIKEVESESYQ